MQFRLNYISCLILWLLQGISFFSTAQSIGPRDRFEQAKIDLTANPALKNASFSWCFRDVTSGKIIDSSNTELRLIPASTAKLTTTAAALELFGAEWTYQTNSYIRGEIKRNSLVGDLIISGSGDPSFGSGKAGALPADSILGRIASALKRLGIKRIKGRIIVDPHALPYSHLAIPGSWQWEDMGNYYGAGIYGVNWRSNSFSVTCKISKTDSVLIESVSPRLYGVEVKTVVKSNEANPDQDLYIYSSPLQKTILIDGNIHAKTASISARGALPDPPFQFASELRTFLDTREIDVKEGVLISEAAISADSTMILLETFRSPALKTLIREINQESNNLFAEGIFRAVGLKIIGSSDPNEIADSLEGYVKRAFNLSDRYIQIMDGSGLSRKNLLSTGFQTELLVACHNKSTRTEFLNSLSAAGISGTLKSMGKIPDLLGKTGSMSGVRAYAGFFRDADGKQVAFSILLNNFDAEGSTMKRLVAEFLAGASERVF